MSLIAELHRQRALVIHAPCGHEFRASNASLFDALRPLPPAALAHLEAQRAELTALRDDLARRKRNTSVHAKIVAAAVNVGKVVEKIAPSLPGFPERADECRALFEPIDYIVFRGLASGAVDSIEFVDVKSGNARLNDTQREIKRVVANGRVSLFVTPDAKEEAA